MKKSYLYIIIASCLWGTTGFFIKGLTSAGFSTIQLVAIRSVFSAVFIFFMLLKDKSLLRIRLKDCWIFIGTGICSILFFNYFYFMAIKTAGMTVAVILLYTSPLFVTILSAIFFKEKITSKKVIALTLAMTGCALVAGIGRGTSGSGIGILYGLFAGLGYALYTIFGGFAIRRYNALTVTFYTFVFTAIGSVPFTNVVAVTKLINSPSTVLLIIALGIVSSVLPYVLFTKGLKNIEASKASVISCSEPVVAACIGITVFNESFDIIKVLGMLSVIAALLVINKKETVKVLQVIQSVDSKPVVAVLGVRNEA